jgi:hypothetical protein
MSLNQVPNPNPNPPVQTTKSKFKSFPSIDQFRTAVKDVCRHHGEAPSLQFTGTVKIHGSNGGIGWDGVSDVLSPQSRKHSITVEEDNAGFARFVDAHTAAIKKLFLAAIPDLPETSAMRTAYMFGEWCGKGIQKGVGISEVDKMFVVFGIQTSEPNPEAEAEAEADAGDAGPITQWLDQATIERIDMATLNPEHIFHIYQFPTWTKTITFKQPELSVTQNELQVLTEAVEKECPVAAHFGVSGIGEGIVWTSRFLSPRNKQMHNVRFKVKGEKHSATKVKTLASADVAKMTGIVEFVEYAVTDNRLQQGYDELFTAPGKTATNKDIGTFVRWVSGDVLKEESDTMATNKLTPKDIGKQMSNKARLWFLQQL